MSPQLEAYLRLYDELDALVAAGRGWSAEAERVRERMWGPWYALTAGEQAAAIKHLADRAKVHQGGG